MVLNEDGVVVFELFAQASLPFGLICALFCFEFFEASFMIRFECSFFIAGRSIF